MPERRATTGRRASDRAQFSPDWIRYQNRILRMIKLVLVVLALAGISIIASILTYISQKNEERDRDQFRAQLLNITKQVQAQTDQINDCLVPKGSCAKLGREARARSATAITYCALNLPQMATKEEVNACVLDILEAKQ